MRKFKKRYYPMTLFGPATHSPLSKRYFTSPNDELYTTLEDIEREIQHHKEAFRGKTVYMPADGKDSEFFKYFCDNFKELGIKKIIATKYNPDGLGTLSEFDGQSVSTRELDYDGDFLNDEAMRFFEKSDIVVTNPPFSLIRELLAIITENEKEFLLIAPIHAATYRSTIGLFANEIVRAGYTCPKKYTSPDGTITKHGNHCWITTLPVKRDPVQLSDKSPDEFEMCDNKEFGLFIKRVKDIPKYDGPMAVPITFILKHDPSQFRILDCPEDIFVGGKERFKRIIIEPKG